MKKKWIDAYMDTAERFAQLSSASKLKVGAAVVKDHRIISIGYNGMPAGWSNDCEYAVLDGPNKPLLDERGVPVLKTKDEVIHAEANAIIKLARDGERGDGASIFCTHAPCIHCAKLIYGAGITKLYYRDTYRLDDGLSFLHQSGIEVERVK
jgi:dCMP deaminase